MEDEEATSDEFQAIEGNLFDPRYGYVKVELVEYLTDSYYNI